MHHIFGPVPSRRLGRSLGIDLIPYKTCQLDCLYCECGATDRQISQAQSFVDIRKVFSELRQWMADNEPPDTFTFSGSGEPLLEQGLPDLAGTNGLLLADPALRTGLAPFDLILPSLDAVSETVFAAVNHPAAGLTARGLIDGLIALRREFTGLIWLEIFIVPGINDTETELTLLREAVRQIAPDRLQLNTLDRPGTDPSLAPAPYQTMLRVAETIAWPDTEIIARSPTTHPGKPCFAEAEKRILLTVRRRPLSMDQLGDLTGLPEAALTTLVAGLIERGLLVRKEGPRDTVFLTAMENPET
jgi:wyosine [tRNA(Phe)-imidazoG37] synthetase (radical SAM superfamily)